MVTRSSVKYLESNDDIKQSRLDLIFYAIAYGLVPPKVPRHDLGFSPLIIGYPSVIQLDSKQLS